MTTKSKTSKAKPKAGKTAKRAPKAAKVIDATDEPFFDDDDEDDDMPGMRTVPAPENGIRKQTELAGFESPKIPEIEILMAPFAEARYTRIEAQKQEKIAGEALDQEMLARGLTKYIARDGDVPIEVTVSENKRKLKLKKLDPEDVA